MARALRKNPGDPEYGRRASILCKCGARNSHSDNAERRYGRPRSVVENSPGSGNSSAWRSRRGFARGAIHQPDRVSALVGDSVVGRLFSLEVFRDSGIHLLFFGGELFFGRLWGSFSPTGVESPGTYGVPYRRAHVWDIRESAFCDRHGSR